ncbi:MAG: polymer-forming cytoskeletal protein [Cyclobacteriaceae bacterium]
MFNTKEDKKKMSEESGGSSNIFGKGTVITGNLETYGNIRVEGKIIGDLKTKSKAVMGHSSNVEGNILAQNAEIAGQVMGTVEVSELLVLKPSAVINGDIITNKLIVESGATFNGGCKMGVKIKEIKIGEPEQKAPLLKAQS